MPEEGSKSNQDPYPSFEKKKEIVAFFRSNKNGKLKTLDQMKHRFKNLTDLRLIYKWETLIESGIIQNSFDFSYASLV